MLLDIKKIFGTYDEPVTAALELDLSEEDFPGYTVPGTVEARITATLQGRMLEIALDITADVAFACARCLEERTRRFHVIKTYCVREADLSLRTPSLCSKCPPCCFAATIVQGCARFAATENHALAGMKPAVPWTKGFLY